MTEIPDECDSVNHEWLENDIRGPNVNQGYIVRKGWECRWCGKSSDECEEDTLTEHFQENHWPELL